MCPITYTAHTFTHTHVDNVCDDQIFAETRKLQYDKALKLT